MTTKTRLMTPLATFALLALTSTPARADIIVYQDIFDNDTLATNAGIGGGLGRYSRQPGTLGVYPEGTGTWVDNGQLSGNSTGANDRGNVYSLNSFLLTGGFKLTVTYAISNTTNVNANRVNIGLIDRNSIPATQTDTTYVTNFLAANQDRYGIGLNMTTDAGFWGLNFADDAGAGTVTLLSNAQAITTGTHTWVLEVDGTGSNWSYSIDGATATTGTFATAFDLTREYKFFGYVQDYRNNQFKIDSVTLTRPGVAASLNLTIAEVGGGVWELTLAGAPDSRYELRSSTDLVFTPGSLVQGLTQGNPGTDPGTISGPNDEFVTTDGNGDAVVRVTSAAPRNFFRAQDAGPLVSFNFEAGGQGFTPSGDWAWGVAASDNGVAGGQVTGGYGSATGHCWATVLGDGGPAINGGITPSADSILTSPDIDLTGVTGTRLTFAAAVDAASGDTLEVRVRDADDDSLLDTLTPFTTFPANAAWQTMDLALPATADDNTIYLEFRFQGANANYLGFYLDDVAVTY